jgi:hypothetical protein
MGIAANGQKAQHSNPRSRFDISSSEGWVYTVVVKGVSRENRCNPAGESPDVERARPTKLRRRA